MRNIPVSRTRRHRRGAALVEMAVLLPILIYLLVAAVDFGRLYYHLSTLPTCARNGALWASDPTGQSQSPYATVTEAALADATNLSPAPTVVTQYSSTASGTSSATPLTSGYVEVTVSWTFSTIGTYPGIPSTTTLTRSVRMRIVN